MIRIREESTQFPRGKHPSSVLPRGAMNCVWRIRLLQLIRHPAELPVWRQNVAKRAPDTVSSAEIHAAPQQPILASSFGALASEPGRVRVEDAYARTADQRGGRGGADSPEVTLLERREPECRSLQSTRVQETFWTRR